MSATEQDLRRSRLTALGVALLFFGSLAVALFLFYGLDWRPASTANYGQLINPARPLQPFELRLAEGTPYGLEDLKGKWTFVYLDAAGCREVCRETLYKLRQVRLTQGREMHRIQGLLVVADPGALGGLRDSLQGHEGLQVVSGAPQDVQALVAQFTGDASPEPGRAYIVDPLGNLMMTYQPGFDAQGMKKDVKVLLRLSHVG